MRVPLEFLEGIEQEDAWVHTEKIGVAPGTDRLGEDHWGVFEYEGNLYRVKFIEGSSYWLSEMGRWEDPFAYGYDYRNGLVECEPVEKVAITTYKYVPKEM